MVAANSGNALVAAGPIADDVGIGVWADVERNCNIHTQHKPNPIAAWWFRPRSAATSL
jgi:hypothetical protein